MRKLLFPFLIVFLTYPILAQNSSEWFKPLTTSVDLLGDWDGEGAGDPGNGVGGFSFKLDLKDHVLIRTNYAKYPATDERPAYRHDDLMITYAEGGSLKAIYFDNEGHVIRYNVETSPGKIVYVSEGPGPGFRLTYRQIAEGHLTLTFEIAPPDRPAAFKTYIQATAKRR